MKWNRITDIKSSVRPVPLHICILYDVSQPSSQPASQPASYPSHTSKQSSRERDTYIYMQRAAYSSNVCLRWQSSHWLSDRLVVFFLNVVLKYMINRTNISKSISEVVVYCRTMPLIWFLVLFCSWALFSSSFPHSSSSSFSWFAFFFSFFCAIKEPIYWTPESKKNNNKPDI